MSGPGGTANAPLSVFFPEAQKEWTQNDVNEQILKFFISGNIPFNQADNPQFQKLIRMIKVGKSPAKPHIKQNTSATTT